MIEVLRAYADFNPGTAHVLDIGCGDAGTLIAMAEQGAVAAGLEVDPKSLRRAALRAGEHGVTLDQRRGVAEEHPVPHRTLDLVMLVNVLEHVGDQAKTLGEIRRVLCDGGLMYLVTPKPFALYSLWNDPHYDLAGLVLMPRAMQIWYFEKVRGSGRGTYDVGRIPTRWQIRRLLRHAGFTSLVSPRELWIRYLRERIRNPEEVRPGPKRWLATRIVRWPWVLENRVMRWAWDIAIGSNFFIARRDP